MLPDRHRCDHLPESKEVGPLPSILLEAFHEEQARTRDDILTNVFEFFEAVLLRSPTYGRRVSPLEKKERDLTSEALAKVRAGKIVPPQFEEIVRRVNNLRRQRLKEP